MSDAAREIEREVERLREAARYYRTPRSWTPLTSIEFWKQQADYLDDCAARLAASLRDQREGERSGS